MTEVCGYHLEKDHRDVQGKSALLHVTSTRQPIAARVLMNVVVARVRVRSRRYATPSSCASKRTEQESQTKVDAQD